MIVTVIVIADVNVNVVNVVDRRSERIGVSFTHVRMPEVTLDKPCK